MIAFVLSGGGNRGPLQVGALQALFDHGLRPDFLVGTSAGSINAAYVAACGDLSSANALGAIWRKAGQSTVYPESLLGMAWRVLRGDNSLFPNNGVHRLIQDNLPKGATTFGDLKIPCYVTSVDLRSGRLYLFGKDPTGPLVPAMMASSAVPGIHPPVDYHGLQLVDGGVLANVPASIAMDNGATTIYAVNVGYGGDAMEPALGLLQVLQRTLTTFMAQSLLNDLDRATDDPAIDLHHIHIDAFGDVPFNDFSHVDAMIEAGYAATDAYLADPQPRSLRRSPRSVPSAASVPGVQEYIPPTQR